MALIDKLTNVADAIRGKTGKEEPLTLEQMATEISAIDTQAKTYILMDEDGNEIPAVLVDEPVEITATANDIRIGTTAVTGDGVTVGTKEIPSYHTVSGYKLVTAGSKFTLAIKHYEYTKLQAILCGFNKTVANSISAEKVLIENHIYSVRSTAVESSVTIDAAKKQIDFGLTNDSGSIYLIRYFSYKEID